jgi:hypothetical protein
LEEMESLNPRSPKDLEAEEAIRRSWPAKTPSPRPAPGLTITDTMSYMRNGLVAMAVAILAMVGLTGRVSGHEGHEHKVMGTVLAIDEKTIEVQSADRKQVSAVLSSKTKYLRDKTPAARTDVMVGERVVIVVVEDPHKVQNVKEVLLGATPPTDQKH